MAKAHASIVIPAPADTVWSLLRDFAGIATWHAEAVAACEMEDGRAGDQVGGVRSFTLRDGTHLRERLLAHSDVERAYAYDFQTSPFDVDDYHATIRVTPVTDGDASFVEWWATFDCDRDAKAHWVGFFETQVFQGGLAALAARFAG